MSGRLAHDNAQPMFTMHLDFLADDEEHARDSAADFAEALALLCPTVDAYRVRVSVDGESGHAAAVYCNAGHDDDLCLLRAEAHAVHRGLAGEWRDPTSRI